MKKGAYYLLGISTILFISLIGFFLINTLKWTVPIVLVIALLFVATLILLLLFRKNRPYFRGLLLGFFVVTTFLVFTIYSNSQKANKNVVVNINYQYYTDEKGSLGSIPFYKGPSGLIYVKTKIMNDDHYMIFDTGAGMTVINEELLTDKELIKKIVVTDANRLSENLDLIYIDSFKIGGLNVSNFPCLSMKSELPIFNSLDSVEGFLGADIMKSFIWDFDMKNQLITVYNESLEFDNEIPEILDVHCDNGAWYADVIVEGVSRRVMFDSGSNIPFELKDSLVLKPDYQYATRFNNKSISAFMTQNDYDRVSRTKSLTEKQNCRLVFTDVGLLGELYKDAFVYDYAKNDLLGVALFWEYERVVLDFKSNKFHFFGKLDEAHELGITKVSERKRYGLLK